MRYLLIIVSFLFYSCSVYDLAGKMKSGTMIGDDASDCMNIARVCADKNGVYNYNSDPQPEDEWLCTCYWE